MAVIKQPSLLDGVVGETILLHVCDGVVLLVVVQPPKPAVHTLLVLVMPLYSSPLQVCGASVSLESSAKTLASMLVK